MSEHLAPDRLRSLVLRGVAWKTGSAVVLRLSRVVTAVILARLLAPSDFGLAAMVLVASSLVLVFSDLALGSALVQRAKLTEADRSTVFWTSVAAGVLFTVGGFLLSGPIAGFYGEPKVQPLFAAFSLTFVVTALSSAQVALLNREMDFRTLEIRQIASYLVGAVVGIVAAARGYGAWAIIAQQISVAFVSTFLLTVMSPWRPRLVYSLASLRDLGGFGARVFGTRLLFYLNRNADNVLIGRFLGASALGAYSLAYNLMLMPFSNIAGPIQQALFPAFSRMQDDSRWITAAWIRVNRLVAAFSIPSLAGLIVVAPDFVQVVLGERWSAATPVIQVLCWVGMLQSLQRLNSAILEARDRTGTLLLYSLVAVVASLVAFAVGLRWGIVGVAVAYAVSSTVVEPYYTWLTGRAIGSSLREFLVGLRGVVEATVAMAAGVLAVRLLLVAADVDEAARLLLSILVGAAIYLPLCARRAPDVVSELRRLRPRRGGAAVVPAGAEASKP